MTTLNLAEIKVDIRAKAPIPIVVRNQLMQDAKNIKATAVRKQVTLRPIEEVAERRMAQKHFELGCWLHYYSSKVGLDSEAGFKARVECAMRLFLSDIASPSYGFFTVFDFGERQFDSIFEMGDAGEVIDRLRYAIQTDSSGLIEKAFGHYGWALEAP
jgi:hypothetical protein